MKKLTIFIFAALFASTALFAQDLAKVKAEVEKMNKVFTQAMLDNDTEKMLATYADDIISMPSYQPMIRGLAKVREISEMQAESGWKTTHFELNTTDVMLAGDFVIEVGTYDMKMSGPDIPEWPDNGKYITIYEVQKDGSLKVKIETWNTDTNPWAQMNESKEEQMEKTE